MYRIATQNACKKKNSYGRYSFHPLACQNRSLPISPSDGRAFATGSFEFCVAPVPCAKRKLAKYTGESPYSKAPQTTKFVCYIAVFALLGPNSMHSFMIGTVACF